jgi:hypothetical protein
MEAISTFSYSDLNFVGMYAFIADRLFNIRWKKLRGLPLCSLCFVSKWRFNLEGAIELFCRTSLHKIHTGSGEVSSPSWVKPNDK